MKRVAWCLALAFFLSCSTDAFAKGKGKSPAMGTGSRPKSESHSVKGYTTKSGKTVMPHHSSNPNKTQKDNFSTKGNTNPFTGKAGTKIPKK